MIKIVKQNRRNARQASKNVSTRLVVVPTRKARRRPAATVAVRQNTVAIPRALKSPPSFHPFEHCVYGPVHSPGDGTGVPDGSNMPSIVMEFRYTLTIRPDSTGTVAFAHIPSPLGSLALNRGICTITINRVNASGSYSGVSDSVFNTSTPTTYALDTAGTVFIPCADTYGIVPFREWLVPGGGVPTFQQYSGNAFQPTNFRVVASVGSYSFTGASLHNAGVSAIARSNIRKEDKTVNVTPVVPPIWGAAGDNSPIGHVNDQGPIGQSAVTNLAGVVVNPVTDGADMINVPHDFEYQSMRLSYPVDAANPVVNSAGLWPNPVFGQIVNPASAATRFGLGLTPEFGHADSTFVHITGMEPEASVTYTSRTCVEFTLQASSVVSRFAKLGPPAAPAAVNRVKALARQLPAAKPPSGSGGGSWLSHAVAWYANTEKAAVTKAWQFGSDLVRTFVGRGNQVQQYVMPSSIAAGGYNPSISGGMQRLAIV